MVVSYRRFLVVVWNSLPPLWLLWAVEMMTAMENPDQRDDEVSQFTVLNMHSHHNQQPSRFLPEPNNNYYELQIDLIMSD